VDADRTLVDQVVKFAFLIRLASLFLVVAMPSDVVRSGFGLAAILFITLTSATGLYLTSAFTTRVAAHPIILVIDVLVASAILAAVGTQSPLVIYTLSTAVLIGILLTPRIAVLVMSILISSYVLVAIIENADGNVDGRGATSALLLPITYATVAALGSIMRSLHDAAMVEQAKARRYSADAARERERARLARDMHDSVAKSLHGIGLAAAALPRWADHGTDEVASKAIELQAAAETASQEARDILIELRADTNDRTLAEQLRHLTEDLRSGGVDAELAVDGIGDCDHLIKSELISIADEAVENVRRHSRASRVSVRCTGSADAIELQITDDGVGFEPEHTPRGHFGLVGMRERADSIGATLNLTTRSGAGTTITVHAPRAVLTEGRS
jgi:signal transduction histidine kinase